MGIQFEDSMATPFSCVLDAFSDGALAQEGRRWVRGGWQGAQDGGGLVHVWWQRIPFCVLSYGSLATSLLSIRVQEHMSDTCVCGCVTVYKCVYVYMHACI